MLAAIFIQGGIAALRYPESHVQAAKPVLDAVKPVLGQALGQATDAAAPTIDKAPRPSRSTCRPRTPTGWTTSSSSGSTAA
jgi:hypothetical protein